jgi:hypothetical protein
MCSSTPPKQFNLPTAAGTNGVTQTPDSVYQSAQNPSLANAGNMGAGLPDLPKPGEMLGKKLNPYTGAMTTA